MRQSTINTRMRGLAAALLTATLAIGGVGVLGVQSASASDPDTIGSLVNEARAANGQPGLLRNAAMDAVALKWAQQMAASNSMVHNPDYSAQMPAGWTRAGENIAMGQPTPGAMHTAWMNSPGHRANILGDFTDIGIAFITVNGVTWGVQDFGKYPGHAGAAAPAAARAPVAAAPAAAAAKAPAVAPAPAAAPAAPPAAPEAPVAPAPTASPTATPTATPTASPTAGATSDPTAAPGQRVLSAKSAASSAPFPFGYVVGGVLVLLGVGGAIYGQTLRRRAWRPPVG
jgi:hypothetical protein